MSGALQEILQHPHFPRNAVWWEEEYAPDDILLKEGEESRDLYYIISGTVRVNIKINVDDDRVMQSGLSELTHGDTFGELNLFGNAERSASVIALSRTDLIRIDGVALSAFMDAHPELGYQVLKDYFIQHAALLRETNYKYGNLYAMRLRAAAEER